MSLEPSGSIVAMFRLPSASTVTKAICRRSGASFLSEFVLYALSGFVAKCSVVFKFNAGGKQVTGHQWIYDRVFAPIGNPFNASLAFALAFTAVFWILAWLLYRRKIFIKI